MPENWRVLFAEMTELADVQDLGSCVPVACGFDSHYPHNEADGGKGYEGYRNRPGAGSNRAIFSGI